MANIESTPEMAAELYKKMEDRLSVAKSKVNRPLTLADKIIFGHLDDPNVADQITRGETYINLRADRVVLQDVLGQSAMLQFMQTRRSTTAVPTTQHCDHLIQARVGGASDLKDSIDENEEVYDFLKDAAYKYGVGFWAPGAGIIHQVVLEEYSFPAQIILGSDSHTPNAGGLGAFACGVGGADLVETMAGLPWEVLYPKYIGVKLTGQLSGWTAPKDVILKLAGELTVSGGTNSVIEYFGPGTETLSATGKATICNMGAELGATTSLFPYDQRMSTYLEATGKGNLARVAEENQHLLSADPETVANPEQYYDRIVEIDLSTLEPHIVGPHSPDRARPISALAAEIADSNNGFLDQISTALIGSCTNSSYEDMSRAADVAEQATAHGLTASVPFMVTPGSELIRATIERDGQMASLNDINGTVLANACGPCIGQWRRASDETTNPNVIVTSYNRNFPMRNDGAPTTLNFIGSPEIITAFAIAGKLSFNPMTDTLLDSEGNPFKLDPPKPAPEVPSNNFQQGSPYYFAPPEDGSDFELAVSPNSERIELLQPWDAWNGQDFENMPVLLKAKGKTTTDAISPAGVWLRFRGHLTKFSDNMFLGAINAYTDEAGHGLNVMTGARDQTFSQVAQHYKANGTSWVVVGDSNYGEGSSREHAALSPRLLGGTAVIARSFARIHESNLKKQGLLALTFSDPSEYDRIREDDRVNLIGLKEITPGKPVECVVNHSDGTSETLYLNHTFSEPQLAWFRLGSALNLFHQ